MRTFIVEHPVKVMKKICIEPSRARQEASRREEEMLHGKDIPGFRKSCCPECCLECKNAYKSSVSKHGKKTWIDCKKYGYNVNAGFVCDSFS